MRLERQATCVLCGGSGAIEHRRVPDRLFGVPGEWDMRRCLNCRSMWLDPRPTPEDVHLAYEHYYTHSETTGNGENTKLRERFKRVYRAAMADFAAREYGANARSASRPVRFLSKALAVSAGRRADAAFSAFFLPVQRGGRLLDVGAGSGLAVMRLRALGWNAEGIDVDPAAVRSAQSAGVPVRLGELASHAFTDSTFDAVTMSHVIEHVHDPRALVAETLRVLRPGGHVAIVTPNADSWLHRRYGEYWLGLDPPRHLQLFTRDSLDRLMRDVGFDQVRVTTSVRGANTIVAAYHGFARDGSFDMTRRPPKRDRLRAEIVQALEALRLRRNAEEGEDLLAIAQRAP